MPQLDKYIFFNHVVSLTIFFFLLYIFIRGTLVPTISTTLKYSKKRTILFNEQLEDYTRIIKTSKILFDKKSKNYLNNLNNFSNNLIIFYENNMFKHFLNFYFLNFNILKNNNNVLNFFFKNKKEFKKAL